jgi:hypothetical protein
MIFIQLSQQLQVLGNLLLFLNKEQYIKKIEHLGNASIGGHTRHIIELLQCAVDGHYTGEVDYINRTRNLLLETDAVLAYATLQQLVNNILHSDTQLKMVVENTGDDEGQEVFTTYYREIVYNTEHTIHHLALIKVALVEMKLNIVDKNFGMAGSTIKYKMSMNNALGTK